VDTPVKLFTSYARLRREQAILYRRVLDPNAEALAALASSAFGQGESFASVRSFPGTAKTYLFQTACYVAVFGGRPA
jgi:hypothetical protein